MFNTEIVAKDIDGIKMQLRKAYDGDVPEGLAVFYWLKNNGIGIRDRNGEIVRDEDLYSFCINYGASVDRAIVAAKGEGASNENIRWYRFGEVYIEEGYDNMDFIHTCIRPKLIYNPYNIYILDVDDVAGSIMNPRRF